jgi:alpha-galactosidase
MFPFKKLIILFLLFVCINGKAQNIILSNAKFSTENKEAFKEPGYNDDGWKQIKTGLNWELQGFDGYNGYGWYRIKTNIPSSLKNNSAWKDSLRINLGKIDDCDEVYFNGILISKSGSFPTDKDGYITTWNATQEIRLATNNPIIKWDKENTIAIKVYDGNGGGGLFGNEAFINMVDLIDGIQLSTAAAQPQHISFVVKNIFDKTITGTYSIDNGKELKKIAAFTLHKNEQKEISYTYSTTDYAQKIVGTYTELSTKKTIRKTVYTPYILTPKVPASPQINTPAAYGVGVNKFFLYKIPATGAGVLEYAAKELPATLTLDSKTGIIKGIITAEGEYNTTITIKNNIGSTSKILQITAGKGIALTPPMGWNSWNCWGLSVSQAKVKASAQAMLDKGLVNYGWNFINLDDGWEAKKRGGDGQIMPNEKFPDMQDLGNWLHGNGLKFGIYSSPGTLTCGGYLGSYQHEEQDANTYNGWGIDYLKYDWCSYDYIHGGKDTSLASYQKPYVVMKNALQKSERDVVYSLCQYGMKEVWKWGAAVGGNLWRTTGDIEDSWESLKGIGFSQTKQQVYGKPSGWNDVDMMIVGNVGWGENLHPTRLTPDEQYTHVSLWCLLNNPLLIGCDMNTLDDFTLNLLTNNEVIDVNQNTFSLPAKPIIKNDKYEVWVKQMGINEYAIGIFNFNETTDNIAIDWKAIGLNETQQVRDIWRQKDEGKFKASYNTSVASHGVKLILCSCR